MTVVGADGRARTAASTPRRPCTRRRPVALTQPSAPASWASPAGTRRSTVTVRIAGRRVQRAAVGRSARSRGRPAARRAGVQALYAADGDAAGGAGQLAQRPFAVARANTAIPFSTPRTRGRQRARPRSGGPRTCCPPTTERPTRPRRGRPAAVDRDGRDAAGCPRELAQRARARAAPHDRDPALGGDVERAAVGAQRDPARPEHAAQLRAARAPLMAALVAPRAHELAAAGERSSTTTLRSTATYALRPRG